VPVPVSLLKQRDSRMDISFSFSETPESQAQAAEETKRLRTKRETVECVHFL